MVLVGVKKLVLAVELNHGNAGLSSAIRISQVLLGSKDVNACCCCDTDSSVLLQIEFALKVILTMPSIGIDHQSYNGVGIPVGPGNCPIRN